MRVNAWQAHEISDHGQFSFEKGWEGSRSIAFQRSDHVNRVARGTAPCREREETPLRRRPGVVQAIVIRASREDMRSRAALPVTLRLQSGPIQKKR